MPNNIHEWLTTHNDLYDPQKEGMRKDDIKVGLCMLLAGVVSAAMSGGVFKSAPPALPGVILALLGFIFGLMSAVMWMEQAAVNRNFEDAP